MKSKSRAKPVPVRIVHDEPLPMQYREKDREHMSVRQIQNGYVVNRHGYKNGKHFDEEVFTPTAPRLDIPGRAAPAQRTGSGSRADRLKDRKI